MRFVFLILAKIGGLSFRLEFVRLRMGLSLRSVFVLCSVPSGLEGAGTTPARAPAPADTTRIALWIQGPLLLAPLWSSCPMGLFSWLWRV